MITDCKIQIQSNAKSVLGTSLNNKDTRLKYATKGGGRGGGEWKKEKKRWAYNQRNILLSALIWITVEVIQESTCDSGSNMDKKEDSESNTNCKTWSRGRRKTKSYCSS